MRLGSFGTKICVLLGMVMMPSCDFINEPEESVDIKVDISEMTFACNDKKPQYAAVSNYREYWDYTVDYGENGVAEGGEWIKVEAGENTLVVSVLENTLNQERVAEIVITSKYRNPADIKIIQGPAPNL